MPHFSEVSGLISTRYGNGKILFGGEQSPTPILFGKKDYDTVIPDGKFPEPISLHENIQYVRKILGETVQYTSVKEGYKKVKDLPEDADFFRFQNIINPTVQIVPSHCVIEGYIARHGADYRYQVSPSPVVELRDRRKDNTSVGRKPNAAESTCFFCNDK